MNDQNRFWLTEPVSVPRGVALIYTALSVLVIINWMLRGLLWILIHI